MELFDKRMESVDKQLEKILPDGLYTGTVYEGQENTMRTLISSVLAYRWLSENDVDPDLLELFGDDPDKLNEVLKRVSDAVLGRTESIVRITKKLEKGMESMATRLNVEPDSETNYGKTFGGGNSGGSDSGFGEEENQEGGDEFGFGDFDDGSTDDTNQEPEDESTQTDEDKTPDDLPEPPDAPPPPWLS